VYELDRSLEPFDFFTHASCRVEHEDDVEGDGICNDPLRTELYPLLPFASSAYSDSFLCLDFGCRYFYRVALKALAVLRREKEVASVCKALSPFEESGPPIH